MRRLGPAAQNSESSTLPPRQSPGSVPQTDADSNHMLRERARRSPQGSDQEAAAGRRSGWCRLADHALIPRHWRGAAVAGYGYHMYETDRSDR
jgi:hypothetical protein